MASATAHLSNYRQSPRKVRVVANLIRGKSVPFVLNELSFLPKRSGLPIKKLIESAVANTNGADVATLYLSEITINQGVTGRRFMPRARGSMGKINKRSSHIAVMVSDEVPKK